MPRPRDLPAGQAAVWDALAPHAIAARTLTPATAWDFRDLCESIVLKRDMLAVVEAEGLTSTSLKTKMDESGGGEQVFEPKAHPLLSRHAALAGRVAAGLARFRLAPMGKGMPEVEKPADEWSEFDAPLRLVQGNPR
ncbi:MAG TPA: hypothetical protein VM243_07330 [Phycisphaerae bacterium]|nr:hypothetical protein [Phycisphaerae bacterium]